MLRNRKRPVPSSQSHLNKLFFRHSSGCLIFFVFYGVIIITKPHIYGIRELVRHIYCDIAVKKVFCFSENKQ